MTVQFTFDAGKAVLVIAYLASKSEQVTNLDKWKAVKLLYLADKYHLVRWARPILGDYYRALKYGPVPQDTLDLLHAIVDPETKGHYANQESADKLASLIDVNRVWKYPRFKAKVTVNVADELSLSEIEALDHIITEHGKKDFNDLKVLTHSTFAYAKAWESKGESDYADMDYRDFFEEDPDAISGALEEMLENQSIAQSMNVSWDG